MYYDYFHKFTVIVFSIFFCIILGFLLFFQVTENNAKDNAVAGIVISKSYVTCSQGLEYRIQISVYYDFLTEQKSTSTYFVVDEDTFFNVSVGDWFDYSTFDLGA